MNKPHKHAELIKQWADGAEIELYSTLSDKWCSVPTPTWGEELTYRIKPQAIECWVTHYPQYSIDCQVGGAYATKEEAEKSAACRNGRVVHMREVED
jgi:hypothetical protein